MLMSPLMYPSSGAGCGCDWPNAGLYAGACPCSNEHQLMHGESAEAKAVMMECSALTLSSVSTCVWYLQDAQLFGLKTNYLLSQHWVFAHTHNGSWGVGVMVASD